MSGRLDDEKLEILRSWGAGLAADKRDELRAAGKAILILVDEIEGLQVDVWHARRAGEVDAVPGIPDCVGASDSAFGSDAIRAAESLDSTLGGRLSRLLGRVS